MGWIVAVFADPDRPGAPDWFGPFSGWTAADAFKRSIEAAGGDEVQVVIQGEGATCTR